MGRGSPYPVLDLLPADIGMRYAVISDIHANLEAFRSLLARIKELRADRILCLGDVVGYNADPNECVAAIRTQGIPCVLGNHDAAASGLTEPDHFNSAARAAALWTRDVLTEENRAFLRGLPRILAMDAMVICHGSVNDTDRYLLYEQDMRDTFDALAALPGSPQVCFYGHTHVKDAYGMGRGGLTRLTAGHIVLTGGVRYLVNPGGLGQPRDGDPDAPFLIFDADARTIDFHRVPYDIASCQDKIIRAGLPARLAERLMVGR